MIEWGPLSFNWSYKRCQSQKLSFFDANEQLTSSRGKFNIGGFARDEHQARQLQTLQLVSASDILTIEGTGASAVLLILGEQ